MTERLLDEHDALLLDLDGVLWRGTEAIAPAVETVLRAQEAGTVLRYVTNNASRTPEDVAARLAEFGVPATADEVVTSATAAAAVLADGLEPQAPVLVCGAPALRQAVEAAGLTVVDRADDRPRAVVTGWSDELRYGHFAEAALAVRAGAWWVASNVDATLPTERGPLPGAGALVALVATAAAVDGPAVVAGKPSDRLHATALHGAGARRPLAVGDRLDTDVAGARAAGVPSLAVLTGVADLAAVLAAPAESRPEDVAVDLSVLLAPSPSRAVEEGVAVVGGWRAARDGEGLTLEAAEGVAEPGSPSDAARALLAAWPPCGRAPSGVRLRDAAARDVRDAVPGLASLSPADTPAG